jgi:hypothetical protein
MCGLGWLTGHGAPDSMLGMRSGRRRASGTAPFGQLVVMPFGQNSWAYRPGERPCERTSARVRLWRTRSRTSQW